MNQSNTVGFDNISMSIIKIIPDVLAIYIMHGINSSIRQEIFPDILKITRILPILKPEKNKFDLNSYRPISNLHSMEKIYEEHISKHLKEYLESNEILSEGHHGGRVDHSTLTATTDTISLHLNQTD